MECLNEDVRKQVKSRFDTIAKPIDGMGKFETILSEIGALRGNADFSLKKKAVLVFCSDNGIVEEGVSQSPSEVTLRVINNMLSGKSSVAVMAKHIDADLYVTDIGTDCSPEDVIPENLRGDSVAFLDYKIRRGSRNFAKEPAMTEEETKRAIETGCSLVKELAGKGVDIIALGEMGIGNTTTSSAVCAALTGCSAETLTGRGAGLNDSGLLRKKTVISEAIKRYDLKNKDVISVLQCVGGYDIAALAGAITGGYKYHVPVVLDGVITMAAALAASKLEPECLKCCILSHKGKEPAVAVLEEELIKCGAMCDSMIYASMALGEGTGAVMMLSLLDLAMEVYGNAARFDDLSMEQYKRYDNINTGW